MCIYVDTKCYVFMCMYMPAMLLQLCLTLWDSKDCMQTSSSSVQGILQARILEWVAMPFSRDLPNPGIEPEFLTSPGFFTTSATWGTHLCVCMLAQKVKNPPAMQETWVRSLSWEDPLEESMATAAHISSLSCGSSSSWGSEIWAGL